MKDSFVVKPDANGVPVPVLDKKEESLQRIASSLERLEIILRQLGGQKIRSSALDYPAPAEQPSTKSSTD